MKIGPLLLVAMLTTQAFEALPQRQHLKFEHITTAEGLSQSYVLAIKQDSRGFMWFGTRDGLNKYDGYKFTVYKNIPGDTTSLSNNNIMGIEEDSDGNLWVATNGGGLAFFDRNTETFSHYRHDKNNKNTISSDMLSCLLLDDNGNLWIGTDNGGLSFFDRKKNTFRRFIPDVTNPGSLSGEFIRCIYQDRRGRIWIGTNNSGLNLLEKETGTFKKFLHDPNNPKSISHNSVRNIFEDEGGNFWITTYGGGLNLLNSMAGEFQHFTYDAKNPNSLGNDFVTSMAEDNKGNLWLGTEHGGLSILNPSTRKFERYKHDVIDKHSLGYSSVVYIYKDNKGNMWIGSHSDGINFWNIDGNKFNHYKNTSSVNSLNNNKVLSIYEDSKNNLWIGTDGGGLNLFDRSTGTFKHFMHNPNHRNSICGNYVLSILEDSKNNLWIGTWADGISIFNPERNTFEHISHLPNQQNGISDNNIFALYEDNEQNVWIGTYTGGLNKYDPRTGEFTHFKYDINDPQSLGSNYVLSIYQDSEGLLWVGTDAGGLNLYNKDTNDFTRFTHQGNVNSICNNSVNSIIEDKQHNLWIATGGGLSHFDKKTRHFTNYLVKDGLPNNYVFGILEDNSNNLWLSTNQGLSKFNTDTRTFRNYSVADGLQAQEFRLAYYKTRNGMMYFGGTNGFNEFHPDSVNEKPYQPALVLTDFQIFNKKVPISTNQQASPLVKSITETKEVTLSYKASVFSFEFATLNFTDRSKKKYAYMLEGFQDDWNFVDDNRVASYTNLDPGEYLFKVRGLNNEGKWSPEEVALKINIIPPYWKTWWFKVISLLAIMGSATAFYTVRLNRVKRQKAQLEDEVVKRTQEVNEQKENIELQNKELVKQKAEVLRRQQEAEKAREEAEQANRAKSIFLATMSHEIRTPMNGVLGMASLLSETFQTQEQQEYTEIIKSSGESLLGVINDILDYSKIESGKMDVEYKDFDLRTCVEEVFDLFKSKAAKINLDLVYEIDYKLPVQIMGDSLRLRQVLTNLVGNAIKFTHQGEIYVSVRLQEELENELALMFEVRDTGIGIPQDKLGRLFKSFSQVDASTTRKYGGSGLGLAISEKLVSLMGGQISVASEEGKGTTFSFTIKVGKSNQSLQTYVHYNLAGLEGKRVLVVDDNNTNLKILKNQLEQWKLIPTLVNSAAKALQVLSGPTSYDLVITDMQMPEMDGTDLTKEIRQQYAGLPVILLTSIGDGRDKNGDGLFSSIMAKPVKQSTLYKNVFNLLRGNRTVKPMGPASKVLKDNFSKQYPLNILIVEDNPVNIKLTERVLAKLGYTADISVNGVEALNALERERYDLILMDVQMPEMDGLECTQRIRQEKIDSIIIAMTANAMHGDREICLQAGMNDYISKPIKIDELVTLIEKWAKEKKAIAE